MDDDPTEKKSARREDAAGERFEDAQSDADWIKSTNNLELTGKLSESESRLEQIERENENLRIQ